MKKTLLAATTLSALMVSGMANAAFTDADGSGGWTGNLEFNGAITSTNPAWKYQIPDATIAGAKNWDVKRSDGTVDGSNTNFSFTDKNFTVLEGVMKAPAPKGGPGLQPVVTFGNGENAVVWDTTTTGLTTPVSMSVDAKKEADTVGSLSFKLSGQVAANILDRQGRHTSEEHFASVPEAFKLLKAQSWYATTYTGPNVQPSSPNSTTTTNLAEIEFSSVSASLVAQASDFNLSTPTASIPDAWTATLPISITVK